MINFFKNILEQLITFINEHIIISIIIMTLVIIQSIIKSYKLREKDKHIISSFSFLAEYISGVYTNKAINYVLILKYKENDCFYLNCINNNGNRVLHGFAYYKENIDDNGNYRRYFSVKVEGDEKHNIEILIKDKNILFIEYNTADLESINDIKNLQGVYERKIDE